MRVKVQSKVRVSLECFAVVLLLNAALYKCEYFWEIWLTIFFIHKIILLYVQQEFQVKRQLNFLFNRIEGQQLVVEQLLSFAKQTFN